MTTGVSLVYVICGVTSLSLKNTTGAFIWFLYFWDVNKKKKRQQSKQMYQCIYKVSKNWQHFFGKHSPTRRKSKERFIIVKKIPFLTESDATFCIRWMQNVFLLKENSSKYYLAATSILKVCVSASFKKQNHKTENHVHWDWPPLFQSGHVESTSQGLEKLKCPSSCLSSSDGEDGVVRLAGPTHLHVAEAGLGEHAGVLGRRALAALRLHQHVEGEDLSHDGPPPVLKQHGFHQQDAAAWRDDGQRHRVLRRCESVQRGRFGLFHLSVLYHWWTC